METKNPHLKKAIELYRKWEPETPFEWVISHCLDVGTVIVTESFILIGERTWSDGRKVVFGTKNKNCWFVRAFVSDKSMTISEIMDEVLPAKWLAFCRRGSKKYKIYDFKEFKRRA